MNVKILVVLGFACLLSGGGECFQISVGNTIRGEGSAKRRPDDGEPEFDDDSPAGPYEKFPTDTFQSEKYKPEREGLTGSEVDEETIRKAEKMADKDLLNGLNRILKNNETLKDVLRAENVYRFPR